MNLDPVIRAKQSATWTSERRAQQSERSRSEKHLNHIKKLHSDPATRAKMSAA